MTTCSRKKHKRKPKKPKNQLIQKLDLKAVGILQRRQQGVDFFAQFFSFSERLLLALHVLRSPNLSSDDFGSQRSRLINKTLSLDFFLLDFSHLFSDFSIFFSKRRTDIVNGASQ